MVRVFRAPGRLWRHASSACRTLPAQPQETPCIPPKSQPTSRPQCSFSRKLRFGGIGGGLSNLWNRWPVIAFCTVRRHMRLKALIDAYCTGRPEIRARILHWTRMQESGFPVDFNPAWERGTPTDKRYLRKLILEIKPTLIGTLNAEKEAEYLRRKVEIAIAGDDRVLLNKALPGSFSPSNKLRQRL